MKRLLLSTVLFFCCYCSAFAQDTRAILAILEDQVVSWNRGDLNSYMDHYWRSDSLVFVSSAGLKYGWQNTLDNYKKSYPDKAAMGTLKFNILRINAINTTNAFVMGRWEIKHDGDSPYGYFTLWVREIDGDWKIVADHTSG